MQAKAKRLARFHIDLSRSLQTPNEPSSNRSSGSKDDQVLLGKKKSDDDPDEEASDTPGVLSDHEGRGSSKLVVGKCPDMCPGI